MMKTEIEILKDADPARHSLRMDDVPPSEALERILTTPPSREGRRAGRRGTKDRPVVPRRVRFVLVGLAASLVPVAVLAALPAVDTQQEDGLAATSGASGALLDVSGIASAQAASGPPTEPVLYERESQASLATTVVGGHSFSVLAPETTETWIRDDGSGRLRVVRDAPQWLSPQDKQQWKAVGSPPLPEAGLVADRAVDAGSLPGTDPSGYLPPTRVLPTNVDELRTLIFDRVEGGDVPTNVKAFEVVSGVLMQSGTSPELRSALYAIASGIDGVKLAGTIKDPQGRPGMAVTMDSGYSGIHERHTLIFDPETAQPLAETEVALKPSGNLDGQLTGYTVLEKEGSVPTTDSSPPR